MDYVQTTSDLPSLSKVSPEGGEEVTDEDVLLEGRDTEVRWVEQVDQLVRVADP